MQETVQQYIARTLSYVGENDPVAVLRETPAKLEELARRLAGERSGWRLAPGKWTVRQQVAHLADVEIMVGARIRFASAEPGATIVAFDQEKWAEVHKYDDVPLELSLATWKAMRKWNLALLERLSPEAREGFAMHTERGRETLAHMLKLWAGHDLNHLGQLAKIAEQGDAAHA